VTHAEQQRVGAGLDASTDPGVLVEHPELDDELSRLEPPRGLDGYVR